VDPKRAHAGSEGSHSTDNVCCINFKNCLAFDHLNVLM
jgi:hypothetical protein